MSKQFRTPTIELPEWIRFTESSDPDLHIRAANVGRGDIPREREAANIQR